MKYTIPFIILFSLFVLLGYELFHSKPDQLPSALIGENLPAFQLPNLLAPNSIMTQKNLIGHVSLLNIWASWCGACQIEAPMLVKIKTVYRVPIYGIDYKDDAQQAIKSLALHGNPYRMIGSDKNGNLAIDLGVYGTPETFILSKNGKIIYRHIGIIDQKAWDQVIYPLVKKYAAE